MFRRYSLFNSETRVPGENSLATSKVVSFKQEKRKPWLKKVGSFYDSSLKSSINFNLPTNPNQITEKESINFRNNVDELKSTINLITSQVIFHNVRAQKRIRILSSNLDPQLTKRMKLFKTWLTKFRPWKIRSSPSRLRKTKTGTIPAIPHF
jgi:hypothetical protein